MEYALEQVSDSGAKYALAVASTTVVRQLASSRAPIKARLPELVELVEKSARELAQTGGSAHKVDRVFSQSSLGLSPTTEEVLRRVHTTSTPSLGPENGAHLAAFVQDICTNTNHDYESVMARVVADLCTQYGAPELALVVCEDSVSLDSFFTHFKSHLRTHVEAVLRRSSSNDYIQRIHQLRERGNNLMANFAYAQALVAYTTAINSCSHHDDRNLPQILTNRAIAYIGLNCYPEAQADVRQALVLDRCFSPAWTQLGYCHLYMGHSLLALKCYLAALELAAGNILPYNFPSDATAIKLYKDHKTSTLLPQFAHRIASALSLTEKRAFQQREDPHAINTTVSKAVAILDLLKANAPEQDAKHFTYLYDSDDDAHERLGRNRSGGRHPVILTQNVAQDILSGTSVEVSRPSVPPAHPPPTVPPPQRPETQDSRATTEPPLTRTVPSTRSLLNDLGEIFEGTIGARAEVFPGTSPEFVPHEENPPLDAPEPALAPDTNRGASQFANVMREYLSRLPTGGVLGPIIGSNTAQGTVTIDGQHFDLYGNPINREPTNRSDRDASPERDVDMPEPDLD